ncbi:uncharacterized protein LOC143425720 [Xylocopa sonorina]|uniref:uncharacterized protein LOC143425720 n=1 Tax=Xylocopa sonorina TaxID=1818115 RepID=UPI00403AF4DC
MDNNFLNMHANNITHENAPDVDRLKQSCLILKKKLVETDEVIKQYNDKLKECERLKQELNASKKQMIDYNSSLAKVIKLQMQNTEYKKNIETLSSQVNDHNIKTAADKQHIQQLICKIKEIEGGQNDKIMQYDLEKSSLQVKVKELEDELKNVKKSYDTKMKKIEKKLPMENIIIQKSKLELKDAETNTTLTKDVVMEKPKVAEKCMLTDEFYTVKDDIYPIFCNKCEVFLDPPPLEKICKIMTKSCPKLVEKISSPVKKSPSPLQVSTDINSEQCKTEKLPTLGTPPPHLQNHASSHTDFIPPSLLPSHTHTLSRTDYCNTFSPTSNLMNQSTYYIGSTPINHLPMTTSNPTNQNNHCGNIATMASSLSLQKRVDVLEAKLKKLNKKSGLNNSCCNHQLNAYHAHDMNSSMQLVELCKTMMNFCNNKEKSNITEHKKSKKLVFESRKPKLSVVKQKRLQSTSNCSWKVESVAQKIQQNPLKKRHKKHKRRYCVPLDKTDDFSKSTEDLEKMDCESDVDLSTDMFDDIGNSKVNINLESNSTSHVEPSISTLKTNETGAKEVGVVEVVQDLVECNKSGGEVDSGILSDSVESSKLVQLETDMDTCSELMAKKDLVEINCPQQSESSSIENVKSAEAKLVDESTIKETSHSITLDESAEKNNSLEISKPDPIESDKLVQLAADLDTSSESIEENNLMETNSSLQSESSAEDVKSTEAKLVDESTIKETSHSITLDESAEKNNSLEISKPDPVESDKLVQLAADLDTSSESIEENNLMEANSSLQSESSAEDVKSTEAKLVDESTIKETSHSKTLDESTEKNNSSEVSSKPDSVESNKLAQLAADLDTSSESIEENNSMEANSSLQTESSFTENVKSKKPKVFKSPVKVASRVMKSNESIERNSSLEISSKSDSVESDKLVQLVADLDTSSESIEENNLMEVDIPLQSDRSSLENVKSNKTKVVKSVVKASSCVMKSNESIEKNHSSEMLSKPDSVESNKLAQLAADLDTSSESVEENNSMEASSSLQSEPSFTENVKSKKPKVVKSAVKAASLVMKSNESIEKNHSSEMLSKPDSVESNKLAQLAADLDTSSESVEENNSMEASSFLQSEPSFTENIKSKKLKVVKSPVKVASRVMKSNESIESSNSSEISSKPDSVESDKLVQLATDLDTSSESIEENNSMEASSSLQSEPSFTENVKSKKPKVVKSPVKVASRVMKSYESIERINSSEILSKPDSVESNKVVQLATDLDTSSESIEENNSMEASSSLQSEPSFTENVKSKKPKVVKSPVKVASRVMKSYESIERINSSEILSKPDSVESNKVVQLATDLDTSSESIEENNLMEASSSLQSEPSFTENVKSKKPKVVKSPVKVASRVMKSYESIERINSSEILSKPDSVESNKVVQLATDLDTSSESVESSFTENVKSRKPKVVKSRVKVASRVMKSNESIEENSSLEKLSNDDKPVEETKQTNILEGSPVSPMAQHERRALSSSGITKKRKISEVQDSKGCSKREELLRKIKRLKKSSTNSSICPKILEPPDVQDEKVEDSNILPEPKILLEDISKEENYAPIKKARIAHIPKIAIIERKKSIASPLQLKKRLVPKVNNSNAQTTQVNSVSINKSQQNSENKLSKIYSDLFNEPQSTLSSMPNFNKHSVENAVQEKSIPDAKNVLNTLENKTSLVTDINNYGCLDVSVNQSIKMKEAKTESNNYSKYLKCERENNPSDIKEDSGTNSMKEKELLHANARCPINPVEISNINEINVNAKEIVNSKKESSVTEFKLQRYCPFAKLRHYVDVETKKRLTKNRKNFPHTELNVGLIADKFVNIQLQRLMDNEWQASVHWDVIEKLESTCSARIIAKGIVEFLSTEEECNKALDKTHTPPAPLMSVTQQRIAALLVDLEKVKPTVFEFVQAGIEYKLFRLNQLNQRCIVESLSRMYTILARIKKDRERVRIFCCDALYCLGLNAICALYTVLTSWAEVFPNNEADNKILPRCMAHLILTLQVTDFPKLNALKNLLTILYKYPSGTLSKDILKELLTAFQENCRGEIETSIILLAKREGTKWAYQNVIKGALLPMIINNKLPSTYRAFCLLGNLLRTFPIEDKDKSVGSIIEQLCCLIDSNEGSNDQKEGVISALLSLSRHNFIQVVKNTLKWIPNLPIHDRTIEQIKGLINLRTVDFWRGYLRTNKLLKGYAADD